jgi:hypothetical protein
MDKQTKKADNSPTSQPKDDKKTADREKNSSELNVQELEERVAPAIPRLA